MLTAIFVALWSCSKNDEPSTSIKMDNSKMSLDVDDSKKLTVTLRGIEPSTIKWKTSNDFVADVDANGNVEAQHVGVATVYATSENLIDSCLIDVIGKYNTFIEPYVKIGATKSEIKALEKRTLGNEKDDRLEYVDTNNKVKQIIYLFEDGKLNGVGVLLKLYVTDAAELGKFFNERYNLVGEKDDVIFLTNGKVAVAVEVLSGGISIIYIKDTVSKAFSDNIINSNAYEQVATALKELK